MTCTIRCGSHRAPAGTRLCEAQRAAIPDHPPKQAEFFEITFHFPPNNQIGPKVSAAQIA